jgi:DNA-3-methyladenine glycosylase
MARSRVNGETRQGMSPLDDSFFSRHATDVAPDLIGLVLIAGSIHIRLTEVEAYTSDDPASHSFRGLTARNAPMFGPAGRYYVYLIYGLHHCVNIVTGGVGDGQAVLLRGGVIDGVARSHTDGPGKLARTLGIDRSWNSRPVVVSVPTSRPHLDVNCTTRIGITKAVDVRRRWVVVGDRPTAAS